MNIQTVMRNLTMTMKKQTRYSVQKQLREVTAWNQETVVTISKKTIRFIVIFIVLCKIIIISQQKLLNMVLYLKKSKSHKAG